MDGFWKAAYSFGAVNHVPDLESSNSTDENLCLSCGLCCNGVIFADVKLERGEDAARFQAFGLPIRCSGGRKPSTAGAKPGSASFPQPCAALDGCRCRIYADRPSYCRKFECLLLKSVNAGRTEPAEARRIILTAQRRADKVKRLLRALGDNAEGTALSIRFRQTARRMEKGGLPQETARLFGELTLAVHDLNLILGKEFYRSPS